ncbi:MAG: hypothetical protein KDE08_11945 [Rhodobacteraceae bacterium]|nr:hypothetical protein [Paracoccaceae bacterium]
MSLRDHVVATAGKLHQVLEDTMRTAILSLALTTWCSCALADNPDEGMLARIVCYRMEIFDDPTSANRSNVIIVQQSRVRFNDASYFISGNNNYSSLNTRAENFDIYFYEDALSISDNSDYVEWSSELLGEVPDMIFSAEGTRFRTSWGVSGENAFFRYDPGRQEGNDFIRFSHGTETVDDSVICLPPFGVEPNCQHKNFCAPSGQR